MKQTQSVENVEMAHTAVSKNGVETKTTELPNEIAVLMDRARGVVQTSLFNERADAEEIAGVTDRIHRSAFLAPLYFRWTIPNWPPQLLLRKVMRRATAPFWMGQVHFNEAAGDSLRGLLRRSERHDRRLAEQQKQIDELKREIAELNTMLRHVSADSSDAKDAAKPVEEVGSPAERERLQAPWAIVATQAAEKIENALGAGGAASPLFFNDLDESAPVPARQKPRVAFIAPFPPAQTGIADYSAEIVDPLAQYYELNLYKETGSAPHLPASFYAAPLSAWEKNVHGERRDYQSVIYQLGNNGHYHEASYNLLMRYAGITVLHDYLLTHLMTYLCREPKQLTYHLHEELAYEIGQKKSQAIMDDINRDKMSIGDFTKLGIPMNRRVFTRSLGVVLHNQWSYEQAQKDRARDNELITLIPPVIPPVKLGQTRDEIRALRQKWGVPVDAFVFAPCGIVTETKRPYATLDAFKKLLAERPDAFLLFVGSVMVPTNVDFDAEIKKRGLEGRVKITGYVDVPTFNEYLLLSDVCVTLRFPSQGETSGALLRMLVHGKPSIVTAIGSFDDFPDDTVHKLPTPDKMTDEVGDILKAFRLMANNTAYREKVAASGLAYVSREHSPERCARLYATFVDEVMTHPATRKKLVADWAGRDIARRSQIESLTVNELLSALERSLIQTWPQLAASAPV